MKKKVFGAVALIAIAVAAGWNYQQSQQERELSDLTLENIEALASGENGNPCGGPKVGLQCESRNTINCKDTYGCS